jgi:hypothetical protein
MLWCVAGVVARGISSDYNTFICGVKQPGLLGLIDLEDEDATIL